MPQGTPRKHRLALLSLLLVVWLGGMVSPTAEAASSNLEHLYDLKIATLGQGSGFQRTLFGADIARLQRPVALDVRGEEMIIADADALIIYRYHLKEGTLKPVGKAGMALAGDAGDLTIADDGSFFVADPDGHRVLHFSPAGKLLHVYRDEVNLSRPISVVVDEEAGQVLVADELFSHIVVFDRESGQALRGIGRRGHQAPGRFRIITDMVLRDGRLYVAERVEWRLQVLDLQGRFITHFGQEELRFPQALAVTEDGRVLVADRMDNRIRIFKDGRLIERVGRNGSAPGEFRLVNDMTVVGDLLYVADSLNRRIQVFRILPPPPDALGAL